MRKMHRPGRALHWLIVCFCLAVVGLAYLMYAARENSGKPELFLYCAAGIQPPVKQVVEEYQRAYGISVRVQYGGSGQLLSNIELTKHGDLYLAADTSYIATGRRKGLLAEAIPVAQVHPVIAVAPHNPKHIQGIADLLRADVRIALANPEQAAIGQVTKKLLEKTGQAEALIARATVLKPTVNDLANDVKIGSVDAAIVWDSTVKQYPGLEAVGVPLFDQAVSQITIAVIGGTTQPTAALRFARFLAADDRGQQAFRAAGYVCPEGDAWAETPEILFYSGAVNRVAIAETLRQFEQREGVRITTIYNGCGILVAQMKAAQQKPDAYLACDVSFVPPVAELFLPSVEISDTDIVIAVPRGNPKHILTLEDLGRPGLAIGLAHEQQSTLGALTRKLLDHAGIYTQVSANVRSQTPTADTLVAQAALGTLDAVVVYQANLSHSMDKLEAIPIAGAGAKAVQPFSIGKGSQYKQLVGRLLARIKSDESRRRYEALGFQWRARQEAP